MSALKIALLGPPEVDHRDRQLTFPDRKVLALLAYLATEGGMQERQKLTRLLWPESDMAHGRATLRLALLHLRRILEEDASPEGEFHLLITHDMIGLDLASPLRNFARLPGWLPRTDLLPWMRPCRTSCCASPVTGEKGEEGFPTTLPTTR